MFKHSLFNDLY